MIINSIMFYLSDIPFLAHLWGAYAIPLAASVVRRVSSVSTTRNNEAIKSIFSANVHHVPGLCLLGFGGAPYTNHKYRSKTICSIFRLLL